MWKKIVQRVPVASDPNNGLIALVDMIESELGFHAGGDNLRARLADAVSEIRQSGGVVSPEIESILLDVIERLKKIERLFSERSFGPDSEIPSD